MRAARGSDSIRSAFVVIKTSLVLWEVQARAYALVGHERGTHVLLEPALALNFAY